MLQHVHQQLAVIRIGDFEHVVTVAIKAAALGGVPMLGGDPAGAFGAEAQAGPLQVGAGEDAVAGAKDGVEGLVGYVLGGVFEQFNLADTVDGEVAQCAAEVAPGVEVPVFAVMDEALGRDLALGFLVATAGVVSDRKSLTTQQRRADAFEMGELHAAFADADDQYPLADFFGGVVGRAKQSVQALDQRGDMGGKNSPRIEIGEQVLHGEQGVDLLVGEPHAGQLYLRAGGLAGVDLVAVEFSVPGDRGVEVAAQEFEVTFEGGRRNLKILQQRLTADAAAAREQGADTGNAIGLAHGYSLTTAHR